MFLFCKIKFISFKNDININKTLVLCKLLHKLYINNTQITNKYFRKWIIDSYNYWDGIKNSREAANAGVTQISGYIFSSEYPNIVRASKTKTFNDIYSIIT